MKTSYAIILILGWVLVTSSPAGAKGPLYTSEDGVELYDAPSVDANIVSTLAKGTALQVLETADSGYTRVHTPDNWEGWVSSELLVARQPSAPAETQAVLPLPAATDVKESASDAKTTEPAPVAGKQLASKNLADSVQTQLAATQQELQTMREVNRRLKDESSLKWFIAGAAILLLGIVIGLIVPKIQWRRKSWHSF